MSLISRPSSRLVLASAILLSLAACGNKGPLVMPQKPVPVEVQPEHQPPETSQSTKPLKPDSATNPSKIGGDER